MVYGIRSQGGTTLSKSMKRKEPYTKCKTREAIQSRVDHGTYAKQYYARHLISDIAQVNIDTSAISQLRGFVRIVLSKLISAAHFYKVYLTMRDDQQFIQCVPEPENDYTFLVQGQRRAIDLFTLEYVPRFLPPTTLKQFCIHPHDWVMLAQKVQRKNQAYHQVLNDSKYPQELLQIIKAYISENFPRIHDWTGFLESLPKEMTGMF